MEIPFNRTLWAFQLLMAAAQGRDIMMMNPKAAVKHALEMVDELIEQGKVTVK